MEPRDQLPDEELMLRCRDDDLASFEILLNRYKRPLLNYIYRFIGDRQTAEDIFQETFLKIFKNRATYEHKAKFSTFAYTIATNLSINELKKRKLRKHLPLREEMDGSEEEMGIELSDNGEGPEEIYQRSQREILVKEALQKLPEKQRTVLILSYYEGMPYEEIAKVMKCSIGTVKSRVHRAKKQLYEYLKKAGMA